MKLHLLLSSALLIFATIAIVHADPILPYQQPIAQQLTNDIDGGTGDANTLNRALTTYHRASRSLSGDIGILRDLNNLLASNPNYPTLLSNAASAYLTDFQARRDAMREQLRPAPRSTTKDSANLLLRKIDRALATAEVATATTDRIQSLATAATKIPVASNTVQRALKQRIGLSSMSARIGVLKFTSSKGFITGGTNFQSGTGATIGEFAKGLNPNTGVLK
jgi:hypothetical protein